MARLIALLRAINVGGRKLPMAELRALCGELGWRMSNLYPERQPRLQRPRASPRRSRRLEKAIKGRFGIDVPVIVRTAAQWAAYASANPFAKAAEEEPNRLQLLVSKRPPDSGAAAKLMERARAGEAVAAAGGALWFHFPEGVGTSKLTPALIDKAAGSALTGRNWRTVLKLQEMAQA
jgi:uncharacterized protein (DUF1697 family)